MMSITSLTNVNNGLRSALGKLHAANTALNAEIAKYEGDSTRSSSYIAENIKGARNAALPGMRTALESMRAAAATVQPHRALWADRSLLLLRCRFSTDPATDAMIRSNMRAELAALDQPTLKHVMDDALLDQASTPSEANLATVWACVMAARAAGYPELADISGVAIPEVAEALQLIDGCDVFLAEAEMLVAGATGARMSPSQKLTLARRMQPQATSAERVNPNAALHS